MPILTRIFGPKQLEISSELAGLTKVNRLFERIEGSVDPARAIHIDEFKETITGIFQDRELRKGVTPAERTFIENKRDAYINEVVTAGPHIPSKKNELLGPIYKLITEKEAIPNELISRIGVRDDLIFVLHRDSRKKSQTILAGSILTILCAATSVVLYDRKEKLKQELESKQSESPAIQQLREAEAQRLQIQNQLQSSNFQLARLSGLEAGNSEYVRVLSLKQAELRAANDRVQSLEEESQEQSHNIQTLDARIQGLRSNLQAKETEIEALNARMVALTGLKSAEEAMAMELREKAARGEPLTENEISLVRRVSNQNIEQWRADTAAEIAQIRAAGERGAEIKASSIQRAADLKVSSENQRVEALIVRARNARR